MNGEFPPHNRRSVPESICSIARVCKKGTLKRREGWYGRDSQRVRFPHHLQESNNKPEQETEKENEMEYIMTSYESDEQFIDNMAQEYLDNETYQMSDEEQSGFEDHITEEEEEVEIEPCDDIAFDNAFNSVFGISIEESRKIRKAKKKALIRNIPNIPTCKFVVNVHEENLNRLANHFNKGIK